MTTLPTKLVWVCCPAAFTPFFIQNFRTAWPCFWIFSKYWFRLPFVLTLRPRPKPTLDILLLDWLLSFVERLFCLLLILSAKSLGLESPDDGFSALPSLPNRIFPSLFLVASLYSSEALFLPFLNLEIASDFLPSVNFLLAFCLRIPGASERISLIPLSCPSRTILIAPSFLLTTWRSAFLRPKLCAWFFNNLDLAFLPSLTSLEELLPFLTIPFATIESVEPDCPFTFSLL